MLLTNFVGVFHSTPFYFIASHRIVRYYFSNAFTPSLYMSSLSPLIFTWNFIHLTIAPGAGHSGWEDHFQADQYHYVHHAKFECNYGSPMSGCVDQYLGTFREKLGASKVYTGQWNESNDDNLEADKKAKVLVAASSPGASFIQKKLPSPSELSALPIYRARAVVLTCLVPTSMTLPPKAKAWSPHGYLTLPESWDHAVYIAFWVSLFPLTWSVRI